MSDGLIEELDESQPQVTYDTDGKGRWLKPVWAIQCPETILFRDRCQGRAGHLGDHWCYLPDRSYHYKPHKTDPRRKSIGCGTNPPGSSEYRTPLEMSRHRYTAFCEDSDVTDPNGIERLQRGEFASNESANLPCKAEQIEEPAHVATGSSSPRVTLNRISDVSSGETR